MSVVVRLRYRRNGSSEWHEQELPAPLYFDLDENEVAEIDSVPHRNHAIDYIDGMSPADVRATELNIEDAAIGQRRRIVESFWNGGKNRIVERTDFNGDSPTYWEIIIVALISTEPHLTEILRFTRNSGVVEVCSHVMIETLADGSERKRSV